MIKTIDTNEITEKMFQAFRDNYVDATRCIFAVLAAATAVEPAQAVPVGYCLMPREPTQWMREQIACGIESNSVADVWGRLIRAVDIENKHRAKEPAQAVPVAWLRPDKCHVDFHKHPGYLPLYTVPPAIPADLRSKVLELCELTLINGGPAGMVTAAMMQRAKAIREMMGEA